MYNRKQIYKKENITFGKSNEIVYEDDYVKIPKKKYERDKLLLYILNGILLAGIAKDLYSLFKNSGKPPFP